MASAGCGPSGRDFKSRVKGHFDHFSQQGTLALGLALAQHAGIQSWGTDYIRTAKPRRGISLLPFTAPGTSDEILADWEVLREGDSQAIEEFLKRKSPRGATELFLPALSLIYPLLVLAREETLLSTISRILPPGPVSNSYIVEELAAKLLHLGQTERAILVLESAQRSGTSFGFAGTNQIWKAALRYRMPSPQLERLSTALVELKAPPRIAALARARYEAARLLSGDVQPSPAPQSVTDQELTNWPIATMSVALHERAGRPAEAALWLATISPATTNMTVVEAGRSFNYSLREIDLLTARTQLAVRHRDNAALETLARTASPGLFVDSSRLVIDALIDDGDWKGAAAMLEKFDPRNVRAHKGFADDRLQRFVTVHAQIAALAGMSGEFQLAERHFDVAFLAACKGVASASEMADALGFLAIVLAGAAEGKLDRRLIGVLWATLSA
ncbi:MAG: hypothetical protein ACKVP7_18110 [Hyphomicrobiaceae bacterium]